MFDVHAEVRDIPQDFPGLSTLDPAIVYLMGCRNFNQFCCTWRSLAERETVCPVCPMELTRRGRQPLGRAGNWTHHMVSGGALGGNGWADIGSLFASYLEEFVWPAGAFVMRHGDPRDNAGTIEHLHINLTKAKREGGMSVPLAKTIEEHRVDYARLHEFAKKIDERGGMDWLFSREGIIETQPPVME